VRSRTSRTSLVLISVVLVLVLACMLLVTAGCGSAPPAPQPFTGAYTATPAPGVVPEQALAAAAESGLCPPATVAMVTFIPADQAADGLAGVLVRILLPKDTQNMQAIAEQTTINEQQAIYYTGIRYDYCQVIIWPSRDAKQATILADLSYLPASTAVWSGMTAAGLSGICDTYETNVPM